MPRSRASLTFRYDQVAPGAPVQRVTQTAWIDREPARLGQHIRLSFSARDVVKFQEADGKAPARITVASLGLLGPEGPMPLHLTRWVLDRLSQRWFSGVNAEQTSDTTFVDFVNILQHRMMALYYRAWADANPAVQVERAVGGRVRAMLEAMAGIGLPGTQDPELDAARLRQAGSIKEREATGGAGVRRSRFC